MNESRGYQYNGIDVSTIISLEAQRLNHKFNVLKERVASNKTGLDYLARSAVGVGNAGAYVVDGIFRVPAFLLRGGYKLAEGAGKLVVGLAPTLLNAYLANLQSKAQQAQQNRQNQQTPPPVPPQAEGPQPQSQPRPSNPQGPQNGSQTVPQTDADNTYGHAFPYMQGMNRVHSPNISADPNINSSPTNTNNVNPNITVSPTFSPVYSPTINVYTGSGKANAERTSAKKSTDKTPSRKRKSPNPEKKSNGPLYGLYHNGVVTETTAGEFGDLENKLKDMRKD